MRILSRRYAIALFCLFLGVLSGSIFFSFCSYKWIYKVNGRYLTFTQPGLMQSMAKLFKFKPKKGVEQFIVFGGSASLHAINDIDLSNKLTKLLKRPVEIILVGSDDQQLLDTYEMIGELPKIPPGYNVHIINTWSFWRIALKTTSDLLVPCFHNKILCSKSGVDFLIRNNINPPDGFKTWKNFSDKKGIFSKTSAFSMWLKYFILDKLIKLNNHRYSYLFKDDKIDDPKFLNSPYYTRTLLKLMHSKSELHAREVVIKSLFKSYDAGDGLLSLNDKKEWIRYNTLLFSAINKLGRSKGYHVTTLELPIYKVALQNKQIRKNIQLIHGVIAKAGIPHVNIMSQEKIEGDSDVWWDLVHMNLIGEKIYEKDLMRFFEQIIRND